MKQYENDGLTKFVDQDSSKLILENPQDTELRDK